MMSESGFPSRIGFGGDIRYTVFYFFDGLRLCTQALVLFSVAVFSVGFLRGNTYSFPPLSKEEVPHECVAFSVWERGFSGPPTKVIDRAAIDLFFKKGEWQARRPMYGEAKRLREAFERKWKSRGTENDYSNDGFQEEYEKFLLATETSREEWRLRYGEYDGLIRGGFTDEAGTIYRWRLVNRRTLELFRGAELCYLVLQEGEMVTLQDGPEAQPKATSPPRSDGISPVVRSFFPATGRDLKLPDRVVKSFLDEGIVREMSFGELLRRPRAEVTAHWFTEEELTKFSRDNVRNSEDGKRVLSGLAMPSVTIEGIFTDVRGTLWHAMLATDEVLVLKDGHGGRVMLEHPEVD